MVETTEKTSEKTLSVTPTKTLTLKARGVEAGIVLQAFSHGRTKQVLVEKVKSRAPAKARADVASAAPTAKPSAVGKAAAAPAATPAAAPPQAPAAAPKPSGVVLRVLTTAEQSARAHALSDARLREAEERKIAEEEARVREAREAIERRDREAAEARKREEDERRRHDEETKKRAELEAKKRFGEDETKPRLTGALATRTAALEADEEEAPRARRPGAARPVVAPKPTTRGAPEKRRARLTLTTVDKAEEVRERSDAAFRRRIQRRKREGIAEPKEKLVREVIIPEVITVQELANRMAEPARAVITLLMKQGQMLKITDVIDTDTAQLIAEELGHTVKRVAESDVEEGLFDKADDPARLPATTRATAMRDIDFPRSQRCRTTK